MEYYKITLSYYVDNLLGFEKILLKAIK